MKSKKIYKYLLYLIILIYGLKAIYNIYSKNHLEMVQNIGLVFIFYCILKVAQNKNY